MHGGVVGTLNPNKWWIYLLIAMEEVKFDDEEKDGEESLGIDATTSFSLLK